MNSSEPTEHLPTQDEVSERADFANRHALVHLPSRAVYTFIPKNGCSTLRYSLAVANGALEPDSDPNWIHENINSGSPLFRASADDRAKAPYSFVVLRDPFRRLASAFVEKVPWTTILSARLALSIEPRLTTENAVREYISQMTFSSFVQSITRLPRRALDEHFRPQVDFLFQEKYTRWFSLERFNDAVTSLREDIGLSVFDTRRRIGHDTSQLTAIDGNFGSMTVAEIRERRKAGQFPSSRSLYDDESRDSVEHYFAEDIVLYSTHAHATDLQFAPSSKG